MKHATVTLRNPAEGKTFVIEFKSRRMMTARQVKEAVLRDYPRCIVLKMLARSK